MPIYRVPTVRQDGARAPKHNERLTADSDNYRWHYRGDVVYVASEYALNVYLDDPDVETVDSVPGVDDPYPDSE